MVGHQRVNRAVPQTLAQRIAVALLAQRRIHAHAAVKVADVCIGQMQAVDADVAGHVQAFKLGLRHQRHTRCTADAAYMHSSTCGAYQRENGVQRYCFSSNGHAGQPKARCQCTAGRNAFAQVQLLRSQPHFVAKAGSVLHGAQQHLGIGQRHFRLAKAHAA